MDKKILSKILAVMLVITLTFANFIFLAVYAGKTYAANVNYEEQETSINKTDISFDAYFISDTGEKTHTKTTEMNNSELKLFLNVSVAKGYLKDAIISIKDSNFKVINGEELPEGVESIDRENNTITLKQINKGENREIALPIEVIKDEKFDLNNFSKEAKVNLTGIFVNDSAKELKAEKTILVNLSLSENAEAYLEGTISKYVAFEEEGKKKELLQLKIHSNVVDNILPVRKAEINVEVPTLHGLVPKYISVFSTSTKATNGNSDILFEIDDYVYENGIIQLIVQNEADENNKISWLKNAVDEYIVNLVYEVDESTEGNNQSNPEKIELGIESKLSLYNNEEKNIEKKVNQELELPEILNNVVSFELKNEMSEIAKGYMLVKDAANTEYTQNIEVNIGYSPIVNNIEISKGSEYYSDSKEKQYTATTYYKKIEINRDNLLKLLGENGTIEILDGEEKLATLNSTNTEYVFEKEISEVKMVASSPKSEGTLIITTQKYIKSSEYDVKVISALNKMTTTIAGTTEEGKEQSTAETTLVEPTLQVKASISNSKLSTVIVNEDVELRVALQTNNNTNKLFKNPVIEVELPSYIKEVKINNVNLLYNTELVATQGQLSTNSAGNKVITVKLEGEQTKFNDVLSVEGITLIIGTNLTVAQITPSITQKMQVKVTNNATEVVVADANIDYVAPTGIITLNSISGYNTNNEKVTSMSGNMETGKIKVAAKGITATQTITVINNYEYTCGNIKILGRTPTKANKDISTEKDLGSTFTAKMVSQIKTVEGIASEDVTIYYSEKENATEDLTNIENKWTVNKEEVETVKSYLIVLNNQMAKGDKVSFSYDIEIPEGLTREQSTYSTYKVYYTNLDGALAGVNETAAATVVGLSTGKGVELDVKLSAKIENGAELTTGEGVKEGEIIEYTIKVTNKGKVDASNIKVSAKIPEKSYFTTKEEEAAGFAYLKDFNITEYTETIDSLKVNESKEIIFYLTVGPRVEYTLEDFISREDFETDEEYQEMLQDRNWEETITRLNALDVKIKATATVIEEQEEICFESNEIINSKIRAYMKLTLEDDGLKKEEGNILRYYLDVEKLGYDTYHNAEIKVELPDGLTYKGSEYQGGAIVETISGNILKWTVREFDTDMYIVFDCEIDKIKENKTISIVVTGTCDEYNGKITSNVMSFNIGTPKLEISHSISNTGVLTEKEEVIYKIVLKNTTNVEIYNVLLEDYLSEGLMAKEIKYTIGDNTNTISYSGTQPKLSLSKIQAYEEVVIELKVMVQELKKDDTEGTVSNRFEVTGDNLEKISSNTIESTVNKKIYEFDDKDQIITYYSISGVAWLDENSNGIRELEEETLSDIPVLLLSQEGKTISSSFTGENGTYIFKNIPKGNYVIAFLYDMTNYNVTAYQVGEETNNNDVVTMELSIEGVKTSCAATNVITISTKNINNIDMGLVINPKFDLSLNKTISKVTVQTNKNTTTKTYNNSVLQKIEIPSGELNNATVAIEYLITVKNNGAIAGYAKRIVDYLSTTDLKFNSETNPDWYLGTDGNLYNSTMSNTLLQPGESVTLKLVLTKKVSEDNTGLTNNTAEIYEAFNDEGIEDYNSTPANKASNENDLGQADIIIGPKTGVVLYLGTVLSFMMILTAGIYILNKKVIKKM